MKKTLAAVAVLGAFAGSALAAEVTLYGIVDLGLQYNHIDYDGQKADVDKFSMESGQQSGSRFGFKGTEDLGNGLTVGFVLENQFSADTGALNDSGKLFHRESSLFLQGNFGKVAIGRIGAPNQGTGSWSEVGMLNAFGTSWGNSAIGTVINSATIYDNAIAYQTPSFGGFKVIAFYGMGGDEYTYDDGETMTGVENESSSNRYYSITGVYKNGPIGAYLNVDSTNYRSWYGSSSGGYAKDADDSLTVTLGGSYDFEVAKVYLALQYFDEVDGKFIGSIDGDKRAKGWSALLSADAPVAGGKVMFNVGYYDAEAADSVTDNGTNDFDLTRWIVGLGYNYPLSKRTNVYAVANYLQDKIEYDNVRKGNDSEPSQVQVMVGMRHTF